MLVNATRYSSVWHLALFPVVGMLSSTSYLHCGAGYYISWSRVNTVQRSRLEGAVHGENTAAAWEMVADEIKHMVMSPSRTQYRGMLHKVYNPIQ